MDLEDDGKGIREARKAKGDSKGDAPGDLATLDEDEPTTQIEDVSLDASSGAQGEFANLMKNVSALYESGKMATKYDELVEDLEAITELSSDIEFGKDLIKDCKLYMVLSGLDNTTETVWNGLNEKQKKQVQDLSTRCLANALRNNEEALNHFCSVYDAEEVVSRLIQEESSVLLKRRLGLLGALILNEKVGMVMGPGNEYGLKLLNMYSEVTDDDVRTRIVNVLKDLEKSDDDDSDGDNHGITDRDNTFAKLVQERLQNLDNLQEDEQGRKLLENLSQLKQTHRGSFEAKTEFLDWLNSQVELEKKSPSKLSKRDTSKGYSSHLDYLIDLRHGIFGNAFAVRKAYADEL
ncbi:DEKNAAC101611 [Brettanomyces naardenensis]|uniref:Nucleotide exchange factor SIL1 n=1 Tax=Brettanomyces naardenensis TaxID=13370 RepID=A0A448YIA9_BRENA|nr:DEKNAAC101611 [Brettanomyces naardenensis]